MARAEVRRAEAIAHQKEMEAEVTQRCARLVLAEAKIPRALARAFRKGQLHTNRSLRGRLRDLQRETSRPSQSSSARLRVGQVHDVDTIPKGEGGGK